MRQPFVSILIVHFNGYQVLKNCLRSIEKIDYKNYEVVIVDNASTDESLENLNNDTFSFLKLQVIKSSRNLGFAGGNNLGYKKAQGEYLLLLNNDTVVEPDLLKSLVAKMESDLSIGALQPKIKFMDTPKYLDNAGAYLNVLGLTTHWGYGMKDSPEFTKEAEIFSAKGACLMTRKVLVIKIGLFEENFGSYFEESDFCWRVWLSGHRVIYFPETFILHKVGFTSKKMDQVAVMLMSTRNRIFSLFKNLSFFNLVRIFTLHLVFLIALGSYYLLKLEPKKSWMIFGAILWNIRHSKLLLLRRQQTQRLRVVSDKILFKKIMKPLNILELFKHFQKVEANFNKIDS